MSADTPFLIIKCRVTEVHIDETYGTEISIFPFESWCHDHSYRLPWPAEYVPRVGSEIEIQIPPFKKGWAL